MVSLVENDDPDRDDIERYTVVYEAAFEPRSLDRARVEFWITENAEVVVDFEDTKRLATRLGVRTVLDQAIGIHEPAQVTESGLISLLDLIAGGEVAVLATVIPVAGVLSATPFVEPGIVKLLTTSGYGAGTVWLREGLRPWMCQTVVRYEPW